MNDMEFSVRPIKKEEVNTHEDRCTISQMANGLDVDGLALFHSSAYEKIFGTKKKTQKQSIQRLSVVKITNKESHRSIYRAYRGASITGLKEGMVVLSPISLQELSSPNSLDVKFSVTKGCWWMFYRNHPNAATRISFRLGLISLAIGVVSIIISVLCYVLQCK